MTNWKKTLESKKSWRIESYPRDLGDIWWSYRCVPHPLGPLQRTADAQHTRTTSSFSQPGPKSLSCASTQGQKSSQTGVCKIPMPLAACFELQTAHEFYGIFAKCDRWSLHRSKLNVLMHWSDTLHPWPCRTANRASIRWVRPHCFSVFQLTQGRNNRSISRKLLDMKTVKTQ